MGKIQEQEPAKNSVAAKRSGMLNLPANRMKYSLAFL
jgi:hypothetical protein